MSAITTGKYVGGRERIGPRNKDVIGQAIGSTLENLGTSFGENIKQQQQREIQQSLLNEFTDPNTSLQRKQAISLQLNPKSATDILNQSYIDKILNTPEENVTRPIKDVSAPFNGINNAQPEANQVPNPAPVTPVTPNINDLMSELNQVQVGSQGAPVDPYAQKRLEAEQLQKKSQQLKRFGANDIGNALQNEANQKFQDIRNSQTADAQIYRADKAAEQKEKAAVRAAFVEDRNYNTAQAKPVLEHAQKLRDAIPLQEAVLASSRRLIESGDLDPFGKAHISTVPGLGWLKNASAAEFDIARKQNLISTLSKVSARATNVYLEKLAASAFPEKGRTKASNLASQEMIEANLALEKADAQIATQLEEDDISQYGYPKADIGARKSKILEPIQKDILDRTAYRIREIHESEKTIDELKRTTEKPVPKGTPLTRKMMRVLIDKSHESSENLQEATLRAIKRAKQLGYTIYPNEKVFEYEQ